MLTAYCLRLTALMDGCTGGLGLPTQTTPRNGREGDVSTVVTGDRVSRLSGYQGWLTRFEGQKEG